MHKILFEKCRFTKTILTVTEHHGKRFAKTLPMWTERQYDKIENNPTE